MSIGLLDLHVKKGSKISGGNSKLWCFFLIIFIMSFNIDVGVVINDYHCHLGGREGGGVFMTVM